MFLPWSGDVAVKPNTALRSMPNSVASASINSSKEIVSILLLILDVNQARYPPLPYFSTIRSMPW